MTIKSATIILFFTTLLFFEGCKSSDDNDPSNPPGGGTITVTAVSGATATHVYVDDEITITGTGFNADASKDTVELVLVDPSTGVVTVLNEGSPGEFHYFEIKSASATSLVVTADDPKFYDYFAGVSYSGPLGFRVRSGGVRSNIFNVALRRLFQFSPQYGGVNTPIHVGEEFYMQGRYFSPDCSTRFFITLCGKSQGQPWCSLGDYSRCDCDNFVEVPCGDREYLATGTTGDQFRTSIPLSIFGQATEECPHDFLHYQTKMKMINADGKEYVGFVWIYYRPCG